MKPGFALNLTHDGIGLLQRRSEGWVALGEVSLEDRRMEARLAALRERAEALSPQGFTTKLILPNSQILYDEITAPGPGAAQRRAAIERALEGRTPYKVADLVFDWSGSGRVVQVAVAARETLEEAAAFAEEHGFRPVAFVAIPENGAFAGEPFFGKAPGAAAHLPDGARLDRDQDPVRITGSDPEPWAEPTGSKGTGKAVSGNEAAGIEAAGIEAAGIEAAGEPISDLADADAAPGPAAAAGTTATEAEVEVAPGDGKPEGKVEGKVDLPAPYVLTFASRRTAPVIDAAEPDDVLEAALSAAGIAPDEAQRGDPSDAVAEAPSAAARPATEMAAADAGDAGAAVPDQAEAAGSGEAESPPAQSRRARAEAREKSAKGQAPGASEAASPEGAAKGLAADAAAPPEAVPAAEDDLATASISEPRTRPAAPGPADQATSEAADDGALPAIDAVAAEDTRAAASLATDGAPGSDAAQAAKTAQAGEAVRSEAAKAADVQATDAQAGSAHAGSAQAGSALDGTLTESAAAPAPDGPSLVVDGDDKGDLTTALADPDADAPADADFAPDRAPPIGHPFPDAATAAAPAPIASRGLPEFAPGAAPGPLRLDNSLPAAAPPLAGQARPRPSGEAVPAPTTGPALPASDAPAAVQARAGGTAAGQRADAGQQRQSPQQADADTASGGLAGIGALAVALRDKGGRFVARLAAIGAGPGDATAAEPARPEVAPLAKPDRKAPAKTAAPTPAGLPLADKPALGVFGVPKSAMPGAGANYMGFALTAALVLFMAAVAALSLLLGGDEAPQGVAGSGAPEQPALLAGAEPEPLAPAAEAEGGPTPDAAPLPDATADADAGAAMEQAAAPAPAATTEPQPRPALPAVTAPVEAFSARPLDPAEVSRLYARTGIWAGAPGTAPAPAPDARSAGLRTRPDQRTPAEAAPQLPPAGAGPSSPAAPASPPPAALAALVAGEGPVEPRPEGALTAEGIALYAGRPPVLPPPRPASVAAAALPLADAIDAALAEATAEPPAPDPLAGKQPRPRPAGLAPATQPPAEAPPEGQDDSALSPAPALPYSAAAPGTDLAAGAADPALAGPPGAAPPGAALAAAPEAPPPFADPALAGKRPALRPATVLAAGQAALAAAAAREAQAAANLANATRLAVASSKRPGARPSGFSRAVEAAIASAQAASPAPTAPEPELASAPADHGEEIDEPEPTGATPNIPTRASVAKQATVSNAIRLNQVNLIGVYGSSSNRRALVRMSNGKFVKVGVGDRLDGGKVTSITDRQLTYVKGSKTYVLEMPRDS